MRTIYEPTGRALEYSPLALNLYSGCRFRCKYCFNRMTPWYDDYKFRHPEPRPGIVEATKKAAAKLVGDQREILLCFTCDPYQGRPIDETNETTREILEVLEFYKLRVQILSKGGLDATRDFDLLKVNGWRFGTSISCGPYAAAEWEPFAAEVHDRLRSLEMAKDYGISTFLSIEPAIETDYLLCLMATGMVRKIVDEWRVGKLNHFPEVEKNIDWKFFLTETRKALAGKKLIVKKDLLSAAGEVENDDK